MKVVYPSWSIRINECLPTGGAWALGQRDKSVNGCGISEEKQSLFTRLENYEPRSLALRHAKPTKAWEAIGDSELSRNILLIGYF